MLVTISANSLVYTGGSFAWQIWAPANKHDYQVAYASTGGFSGYDNPHFIVDVTRHGHGCGGCTGKAMHSGAQAQHGWRTTDGRPWWLRDTTYSEPNGDYHANCYLYIYTKDPNNVQFNDHNCNYHSRNYLCQPSAGEMHKYT
jgi:hypothetical protein